MENQMDSEMEVDGTNTPKVEMIPRTYQVELMNIALEKNTIIFLPTGSGKTFIALMVLKRMSESLIKSYNEGGKICLILVNSVALVDQHAKTINDISYLRVGRYSGEMNLDFWPKDKWYDEFNKYQVLVMTSQILLNLIHQNFIDLNKVQLLVFDECHHGVNNQPMRQCIKSAFQDLKEPPRILGLTATLLNSNCKPTKVMEQVTILETTYLSKVATVDGLEHVIGYSTNPKEEIVRCQNHLMSPLEVKVLGLIENVKNVLQQFGNKQNVILRDDLQPLSKQDEFKKITNFLIDITDQIETLGMYGGYKSIIAHLILIERIQKNCEIIEMHKILSYVETILIYCKFLFHKHMENYSELHKIIRFSSNKVVQLIQILSNFKNVSAEELCGIIFVERRFTAKVLYYIFDALSKSDKGYEFIKTDFIVGCNSNPFNNTRENLYLTKKNRQIIDSFSRKEVNVLCSSNVLEEGVDIPKCTLVVTFNAPKNYRSYIQSKGRARHRTSHYYIMVDENDYQKYLSRYAEYQEVENTLNKYLIGKNLDRPEPSEEDIEAMFREDEHPPYFVDGPRSAQVNMRSAISLLSQYCMSLPADRYTVLAPELYSKKDHNGVRVIIYLPKLCPIYEPIVGPAAKHIKIAKKAAHLEACKALHKCGELDDHLLPRRRELKEEDIGFLFRHYPKVKEPQGGTNKNRRIHKIQIAKCLKGQITPESDAYLHIIELIPCFPPPGNAGDAGMYEIYTNNLCYGLLTPNECPTVCDFPLFVNMGTLRVSLKVNVKTVRLKTEELVVIKEFNVLVLSDILKALRPFLVFDNSDDAETMLLVPINKEENKIDFDVLMEHRSIKNVYELTTDEKCNLQVTVDGYLKKIVIPWYIDSGNFLVTEVTLSKSAMTPFPNEDFGSFKDYYNTKHNLTIHNASAPLLLVKHLSKKCNYFKPIGVEKKRKKDKMYEDMDLYLLPELVVKQEFPGSLWIQASFLPSIITRIVFLFRLEDFRSRVASECGLGREVVPVKKPLELDENLLLYEPFLGGKPTDIDVHISANENDKTLVSPLGGPVYNKEYTNKMIEAQYPWKDIEEPKDIERCLDVTGIDLDYYDTFMSQKVSSPDILLNSSPKKSPTKLALTYQKDYVFKPIKLLETSLTGEGPELCEIYRALSTAKANDVVNLERLETLGDSLLKFISSLYILTKFPQFDEGRATSLKGRLVSNKNLYYLAARKDLGGLLRNADLSVHEWLPPCFAIPHEAKKGHGMSAGFVLNLQIPFEEQASGILSKETIDYIKEESASEHDDLEEGLLASMYQCQYVGDKIVADCVESLLGAYFEKCGIDGGVKFVEWMGIIPKSENLKELLEAPASNPVLNEKSSLRDISSHIPNWADIEHILGYKFKNKAFLLQALTHSSYSCNRITKSYETLEFLGDAILDFLITCHIYESCGYLDPGQLTDLRSALVNNNTFASYVVRHNLHKFLLLFNSVLQQHITRFAEFMSSKKYQIDEEVLILLQDDDFNLAEYIDVPKVLGDIFEALAGAVYLDSGKSLTKVWEVFHKIMWKEIEMFSANIPKNTVRKLYEYSSTWNPTFSKPVATSSNKMMVAVSFMLNGHKTRVHGFGTNKISAKTAAAKIALRLLDK